jgi:hypothetical protein
MSRWCLSGLQSCALALLPLRHLEHAKRLRHRQAGRGLDGWITVEPPPQQPSQRGRVCSRDHHPMPITAGHSHEIVANLLFLEPCLTKSFIPFRLLFDFVDSLCAQMPMSAKEQVDGIEHELTPCRVVFRMASHIVEANQRECRRLEVISKKPTIQPNWPWVTPRD